MAPVMPRRGFLMGLMCAPAIVRATSLMPIHALALSPQGGPSGLFDEIERPIYGLKYELTIAQYLEYSNRALREITGISSELLGV